MSAGRCDKHTQQYERARRQRRGPRLYDRRLWRDKIRPLQLRREANCRFCMERKRMVTATEVDHIDGNPWNNAESNLRSLCKPCHTRRTSREQIHGKVL